MKNKKFLAFGVALVMTALPAHAGYVGNDPLNFTDPTGEYGRGTGFSDEEWATFDETQQSVASELETQSSALMDASLDLSNSALTGDALSKATQATIGNFEGVMGDNTAHAGSLAVASQALAQNATALRDDGTLGFTANVMNTSQMDAGYPGSAPHTQVAAGVFGQTMNLNRDHNTFNRGASVNYVMAHEPNHHFGRPDLRSGGPTGSVAYARGTNAQRSAFKSLPSAMRFQNPDHLAALTHP